MVKTAQAGHDARSRAVPVRSVPRWLVARDSSTRG